MRALITHAFFGGAVARIGVLIWAAQPGVFDGSCLTDSTTICSGRRMSSSAISGACALYTAGSGGTLRAI